jgi:hypothetical protein
VRLAASAAHGGRRFFFNVTRAATSIYKQSSKVMHDDSRLRHPLSSSDEGGLLWRGECEKRVVTPAACLCSPAPPRFNALRGLRWVSRKEPPSLFLRGRAAPLVVDANCLTGKLACQVTRLGPR